MHWTFEHLHTKKLYVGRTKCVFGLNKVDYLGYIIGGGVIAVDPVKTHAIMDWPQPTYVKHF